MKGYKRKLGQWGEELAIKYLLRHGYKIVKQHWQKREGEIDIIAFNSQVNCLVFIEVKTRTSDSFGIPEESIDQQKKRKLANITSLYIAETEYMGEYRFDVIIIKKSLKTTINHLKNVILD